VPPPVRSLSPEEADLWAKVAATIRPLSHSAAGPAGTRPDAVEKAQERSAGKPARLQHAVISRVPVARPPQPLQNKTLDGTWDHKLRSGSVQPDRIVDLHGMNLDRAWAAIERSLENAIVRGERVVLLITGHHGAGDPPVQRGQIRAAVHDWLAASRHSSHFAAVRPAHPRHGGGGSLYLVLRRKTRAR